MDEILCYSSTDEEDFYKILGCSEHSNTEQITTEYKARVRDCHPDKHPGDKDAATRFSKLQKAKDVLSDPEKRKSYDTWRHAGLAIPYNQWCAMRSVTHTSMHWASEKKQPMLEHTEAPHCSNDQTDHINPSMPYSSIKSVSIYSNTGAKVPWDRETSSDILKKFRNYEI